MIDPASAIGLASSIVQLTTFTNQVISKGRELYESAEGALVEHLELESVARSLNDLTRGVAKEASVTVGPELETISRLCQDQSAELLEAIATLKVDGKHEKWNSFRQALKSIWKEEQIDRLKERVNQSRSQLNTVLLTTLRQSIQEQQQEQQERLENFDRRLEGFMQDSKSWHAQLRSEIERKNLVETSPRDVASFSAIFSNLVSREINSTKDQKDDRQLMQIHEMLRFSRMEDRYEDIPVAYQQTFEWIFQTPQLEGADLTDQEARWDNFTDWLEGPQGLYWITGKPGSGKSTLMKYLYNDRRTFKSLARWTGPNPLITAAFFFWNSGTTMQMSRMGMMQSVLHQVIKGRLDMIPKLFALRWERYQLFGGDLRPLTSSELTRALKLLVSYEEFRFLFFIDGLDEFEGDCSELADLVLQLSTATNVKICTGSRPENVFDDKFENKSRLNIHELTRDDIQYFVSRELGSNTHFCEMERHNRSQARTLIEKVTSRAEGVFLWVDLVIRSLLEGLRDGDDITDLDNRLREIPSDLERLFESILNRLDERYFEQAAKLFCLVETAMEPPSLLTLYFSRRGFDAVIDTDIKSMPDGELEYIARTMKRRVNSRCKGLLEVSRSHFTHLSPVNYLHRTVRDYFQKPEARDRIRAGVSSYDPHHAFAKAYLLHLKVIEPRPDMKTLRHIWSIVTNAINHLDESITSSLEDKVTYLDELDRVATQLFNEPASSIESGLSSRTCLEQIIEELVGTNARTSTSSGSPHWSDTQFVIGILDFRDCQKFQDEPIMSFFEFAFRAKLPWYVEAKLEDDWKNLVSSTIAGKSLLWTAVLQKDVLLIQILLKKGADPNLPEGTGKTARSPWMFLLEGNLACSREAVELFLDHNADLGVQSALTGMSAAARLEVVASQMSKQDKDVMMLKLENRREREGGGEQRSKQENPRDMNKDPKSRRQAARNLVSGFVHKINRR